MYKIVSTKLAVSENKLIVGRQVLANLGDGETAEKIYDTMVDMYLDSKRHGVCDGLVIGGLALTLAGLICKGIQTVKDLRK